SDLLASPKAQGRKPKAQRPSRRPVCCLEVFWDAQMRACDRGRYTWRALRYGNGPKFRPNAQLNGSRLSYGARAAPYGPITLTKASSRVESSAKRPWADGRIPWRCWREGLYLADFS